MLSSRLRILFVALVLILISGCLSAQKTDTERAYLRMQLGISYLENNNLPLALKELLVAEQLDPKSALIQNNLGLVYFLRKKMDLSLMHYTKATEYDPKFTDAKNNLARVYIEVKQFAKAEALLNQVVEDLTYTNQASAYMNYGLMKFGQKKFLDSKALFRKVLETNREYCYAQVYLGRSFLELGENQEALVILEKATALCLLQNIDEAHYFSAIVHYRLGLKDKSLTRFNEAVKLFPEGPHKISSQKMIQIIQRGAQ